MDKATSAALESELADLGGDAAEQSVATTAAVQQTLSLAGFWTGPIDGEWTPALTEALEAFQKELGVKPSGVVDAATVAALEQAIADTAGGARGVRGAPPASPTSPSRRRNRAPAPPTRPRPRDCTPPVTKTTAPGDESRVTPVGGDA